MRHTTLLTLALLAPLSGSFLLAQQPGNGGPPPPSPGMGRSMHMGPGDSRGRFGSMGMWWKNPDLVEKIGLTADQQKKMDDIFQQSRLQLIDLRANVEKQEVEMEPMLAANPPDTNRILAQIDKTAQARAELEKANARMLLGIRSVLTPDQWTKLQAERGNRRMRDRRGPGGPGNPGDAGKPGPQGGESLLGPAGFGDDDANDPGNTAHLDRPAPPQPKF